MACFVEGYIETLGIKLYVSLGKKRRNNGKIADTLFEGGVALRLLAWEIKT